MRTSAAKKSFQDVMKANTPAETTPGSTRGKRMRLKAPKRVAPSTMAASSSSMGTPRTKPRNAQIVKGNVDAAYTSMSPK